MSTNLVLELDGMLKIRAWFVRHPDLSYILGLFVTTRTVLEIIGYTSVRLLHIVLPSNACIAPKWSMFSHGIVNIWLNWDSGHYYTIAQNLTYRVTPNPNYGFFPFYPLVVGVVHRITHIPIAIVGLLLANAALLTACWLLFKLVELDFSKDIARRSVKYLLLLPAAFVFSGMLTESFFIALALGSIYSARKSKWLYAGLLGACLALTRHIGVLIVAPLLFEYLRQHQFSVKKFRPDMLLLGIVPVGTLLFMLYNKHITGNYLAFAKLQADGFHNPFHVIWTGLHTVYFLPVLVATGCLLLLVPYVKRIPMTLWIYGIMYAIVPIIGGGKYYGSLLRYMLVVFPVAICLALLTKDKWKDELLTIGLAMLQGFLMVTWVNCWLTFIV